MSEANLDRVREDLAVMKQVLGLHPPFEYGHVWVCLALAVVGWYGAVRVHDLVAPLSIRQAMADAGHGQVVDRGPHAFRP